MTTAARPTYDPARGGTGKGEGNLSVLSKQYSSRDLTSHTKLKSRQIGQDSTEELRGRDFRRELEDRERLAQRERTKEKGSRTNAEGISASKRQRLEPITASNLDADDPVDEDEDEDNDSDDSDDEDDTAELLAELQRIKRERAEEVAKREAERKAEEERIRTEQIITGNPLLNSAADFKVKRRWDDDVVFKNCAKDDDGRVKAKGFVNDTLRSDFHKRFMERYIK